MGIIPGGPTDCTVTIERRIAALFRLDDDAWRRHANPWSVVLRNTALPLLILAFWSRLWLGWWAVVPVAAALLWTWLNPRIFRPPRSFDHWTSKGVLGHRIFTTSAEEDRRYEETDNSPDSTQDHGNLTGLFIPVPVPEVSQDNRQGAEDEEKKQEDSKYPYHHPYLGIDISSCGCHRRRGRFRRRDRDRNERGTAVFAELGGIVILCTAGFAIHGYPVSSIYPGSR